MYIILLFDGKIHWFLPSINLHIQFNFIWQFTNSFLTLFINNDGHQTPEIQIEPDSIDFFNGKFHASQWEKKTNLTFKFIFDQPIDVRLATKKIIG